MSFEVNGFQVPNAIVDEILKYLSGNELKVYMIIVRKTRGWHKERDSISISQFIEIGGFGSNNTVIKACDGLIEKGLIETVKKDRKTTLYKLSTRAKNAQDELMQKMHKCGAKNAQACGAKNAHTKNTHKNTPYKNTLSPKSSLSKKPQSIDSDSTEKKERRERKFLNFVNQIREQYKPDSARDFFPTILEQAKINEKGEVGKLKIDNKGHLYIKYKYELQDLSANEADRVWRWMFDHQEKIVPIKNQKKETA